MTIRKRKIRYCYQDAVFYAIVNTILVLFALIVLYPLIFIVAASFSDSRAVVGGRVYLWPVDFSLDGWKMIISHRYIMLGYRNTFLYTFIGTAVNLVLTVMAAYPMSRKELPFRGVIMFVFVFTMFFGGGLVPSYILMSQLHLLNTFWIMVLPTFGVYNMVLMRTNFQAVPEELYQSAEIDGCSYWKYLILILLPLSKAILAVITLFYAVGHWNAWFGAMIYLKDRNLYPLQLVLREILTIVSISLSDIKSRGAMNASELVQRQGMAELVKYTSIVAATAPMMVLYPFIQKYFVQGIMIGSLKG